MAITFVSATQGGNTVTTYATTVSGSNPALEVALSIQNSSDVVSGITWNGETMTRTAYESTDPNFPIWIYSLLPVGTGAHNVVITTSSTSNLNSTALLYNGVGALASNPAVNNGNSGTSSLNVTANDGDWIIGAQAEGGGSPTAGANTTFRTTPSGSFNFIAFDSNGVASPTSFSITHPSATWGIAGVRLIPSDTLMSCTTGSFTLTGNNVVLSIGMIMATAVGNFILTGYDAILRLGGTKWTSQSKNSATFTSQSKNSATWTSQLKS